MPASSDYLPSSLLNSTETLIFKLNSLMREKETWEECRHGNEVISLTLRYFTNNEEAYSNYVGKLDELITIVDEDSSYLPVEALVTRPVLILMYFVERVCFECGCCGNSSFSGGGGGISIRKVNFSPVLDKKCQQQQGEKKDTTTLEPSLLTKLHNIHLLLNRVLAPYHKSKTRLLTLSKVQELAREMDGFGGMGHQTVSSSSAAAAVVLESSCSTRQTIARNLLGLTGEFCMQGILLKLNKRKGLQNRIFFLFHHTLIYGTRVSSTQGFRLHGIILTRNMELLDSTSSITAIPYSFSLIVKGNDTSSSSSNPASSINEKILILAAFSQADHELWVNRLEQCIHKSKSRGDDEEGGEEEKGRVLCCSRLFNSSEELLSNRGSSEGVAHPTNNNNNNNSNRSNNALSHVCWHRNISIDNLEIVDKEKHQISGPLLRKFKNSPGWQRLWVVFTHLTLYFYKNANESVPLASLPLLGYRIELLSEEEKMEVCKEHVFKLVFKAHMYYFRAESKYTFQRWVGVLGNAMVVVN